MITESKTYFTKQNRKEKESKLSQVHKNGHKLTIWEKGSTTREEFSVGDFNRTDLFLVVSRLESTLNNKQVLYAFSINGVNYFGKGELKELGEKRFRLECSEDLFKSEKRESFRLLTYPHHEVYVQVPMNAESEDTSNLVSFKTGQSQTGLFKNFLNLVGEETDIEKEGFGKFRVLDISVTGLAFQVGEFEKDALIGTKELKPIHIEFLEELQIPRAEIRYIVPMVQKSGKAYKVGLKFKDIDLNIDQKLGKMINDAMRDFEQDFEDFLK